MTCLYHANAARLVTTMKRISNSRKRYWDLEAGASQQGGRSAELYLYGTIVDEKWNDTDYTPHDLIQSLSELGDLDELNVHIFSNGGCVFSGNAIYALLKQRKETVNIYIEGIAASIASVIAMAGDNVFIAKNAMLMVHNPMVFIFGLFNKIDMGKLISELDRVRDVITIAYTDKTGMAADEINALLDANNGDGTYFSADEAIQMGFADALTPDGKAPQEMAAMIRPNVYSCRGHEIDLSVYSNPPELPHGKMRAENKGITSMAKTRALKKIKAELATVECPHCSTVLDFDTASGIVTLKPEEDATVAVPMEAKGGRKIKAELFKITCPNCGGEFEYETEPDAASQVTPVEPAGGAIPSQAKRKSTKASRVTKAVRKGRVRAEEGDPPVEPAEPVEVPVTCTECGTEFAIDVDPTIEEVVVPCPECGTELTVNTQEPEPEPEPVAKEDDEDEPVAVMAMRKERRRLMDLDEMAKAFPQFSNAIDSFKKAGTSVAAAQRWVFKALAAKQAQGGNYRDAARRDAQVLNKIASPASGNSRSNVIAAKFDSLAARRGVKK